MSLIGSNSVLQSLFFKVNAIRNHMNRYRINAIFDAVNIIDELSNVKYFGSSNWVPSVASCYMAMRLNIYNRLSLSLRKNPSRLSSFPSLSLGFLLPLCSSGREGLYLWWLRLSSFTMMGFFAFNNSFSVRVFSLDLRSESFFELTLVFFSFGFPSSLIPSPPLLLHVANA